MKNNLRYPLHDHAADQLHASSGRSLHAITQEAAESGELVIDDIQISAETLRTQAMIALDSGYRQLAANLMRAAELTVVPNAEVLRMYAVLRPGRSSYDELIMLADLLEHTYDAPQNAALVREAAEAYRNRGLLRQPPAQTMKDTP